MEISHISLHRIVMQSNDKEMKKNLHRLVGRCDIFQTVFWQEEYSQHILQGSKTWSLDSGKARALS